MSSWRADQIAALCRSGEVQQALDDPRKMTALAARIGLSVESLKRAIRRAREHGHVSYGYGSRPYIQPQVDAESSYGEEWDDEPTQQNVKNPFQPQAEPERVFAVPNSGTHVPNSGTPLPPLGAGVPRSTFIDADGNVRGQWIKNPGGQDFQTIVDAALAAFGEMPRASDAPLPSHADDDLLAVYPIGDAHVGMLAWERECGENFDLKIAERNLLTAAGHLVDLAPAAKHALIINVGDFVHADGPTNTTTKGTRVDVDGRWPRVIETAMRTLRRKVDLALRKHEHVTLWNVRGNHDETTAIVLAIALAQFYENEPRVFVDTSPEMFHWYRFGDNLIASTHSDKVSKPADMLGVMVVDRARDWGETKHRRIYCGHLHHSIVKEQHTLVCEWVPTLAGSDAWHRGQGYRAVREQRLDVFHRRFGHINRHIVGIEQIRSMQEQT